MKKIVSIMIILLLCGAGVRGQDISPVAGIVVDADNNPIAGVCVRQQNNRSNYTFTDASGHFVLTVEKGQSVELSLNNGDKVVKMISNDDPIVFDIRAKAMDYGFGVRYNLLESTASISTVSGDELDKMKALNPENSLYGQLPGLAVMENGGSPWQGGNPSMFIRGRGTYQTSDILVLIDGIERPFSALSPEDIESVSVLKDAASLALFGQRGANGVLYVKTKRGRYNSGKEVKVNYQHGLTFPRNMPTMVNGTTYARAVNEACKNDGIAPVFSDYDIADINNGTYPYLLPNVNWFDEALRSNGSQDRLSVSFRGGSNVVAYYSVLELNNEQGIYRPVDFNDEYSTQLKRTVFNVSNKLDIHLTKTTDFSINMTGNIAQFVRPGGPMHGAIFGLLYQLPPTAMPVYAEDGSWGGNPLYITDNLSSNPVAQIANRGYVSNHSRRLAVDGMITQDLSLLLKGLSADVRIGYDNMAEYADRREVNDFIYTTYSWFRDPATHGIPEANVTANSSGKYSVMNIAGAFNGQWRHSFLEGKLNYFFQKGLHSIAAMAGYYQEKYVGSGQYSTIMHQSLIGQAHYSYDQRYVAELALSYSGSNYLTPGDYFCFYPAISGAWIISNESFMRDSKVDLLKLRASFGLSGNNQIAQNLFVQSFTQGGGYPFQLANTNSPGMIEGQMATDNLSPELSRTFNLGFDFMFRKKLSGSLDLFYSRRSQILANASNSTSGLLGVSAPMICTGIVDNKGFETGLTWNDKAGNVSYTIGAQVSYARNKIINMEEEYKEFDYLKSTGRRVGQPFGLQTQGFFNDWDEVNAATPQAWGALRPGDIRYKNQNGDDIIDQNDIVAIASPTGYPGVYFSCNLGLEWKGLGFNILMQGAADYSVNLNTVGLYRGLVDNTTISQYMYDNSWSSERNTPALFPRLTTLKNDNNFRNNDIWIVENSFVKLRNVQIYYKLPQRLVGKVKMSDASIFLNGSNLFSIDHLPVSDPEFIGANYPLMTTYSFGVNFKF